jgi:hypothetical protein
VLNPDRILNVAWANSFFALAREVQEQLEDVDEVQVERERPEHGELLLRFSVEVLGVLLLNRLGIPCGQPDEDEDADDGNYKLKRARCDKEVQRGACDHDADQCACPARSVRPQAAAVDRHRSACPTVLRLHAPSAIEARRSG